MIGLNTQYQVGGEAMVKTERSPSFEKHMRDQGHEFEQGELVSKERASKILNGAAKPCTIVC